MNLFNKYFYLFYLIVKYLFRNNNQKRYIYLFFNIAKYKPKSILEVGVYRGQRSQELVKLAYLFSNSKIEYYGFDMFEELDEIKLKEEYSKIAFTEEYLKKLLNKKLGKIANINLVKGDTTQTLLNHKAITNIDLFFIDGGHSIKTINSDFINIFNNAKQKSVIILDDFYVNSPFLTDKYGCNFLLSKYKNLNFRFSFFTDHFNSNKTHSLKMKYSIKMISMTK